MDQMACDSHCCVDRRASIFDHRLGGIYLAFGSVNRLTNRFAPICSSFKSNAGTIRDAHSYRSACNEGNIDSYADADAVTKPSTCASASQASTPPPIAALNLQSCTIYTLAILQPFTGHFPLCRQK